MPHRQFLLNTSSVENFNVPMYLHVTLTEEPEGKILRVLRSVIVSDKDSIFQPLVDFLALTRHEVLWSETVEDPDMMFGEATLTVYMIERNMTRNDDSDGGGSPRLRPYTQECVTA